MNTGKCNSGNGGNRRQRDTEAENYANAADQVQVDKMESACSKLINLALADNSLANCGKLGGWQNRADQIFDDLVAMRNVCIEQANEDIKN